MAPVTESDLISKLESATKPPVFGPFREYLIPFNDLKNPKKTRSQTQTLTLTRSLAKQFLQFLNRSLSILPKRLSDPSESICTDLTWELFDTYRLCLDCLDLVSSQLSCKPFAVCVQRVRLVYLLEASGFYSDSESEGFRVLERLRGSSKMSGEYLPYVVEDSDIELARVVVDLVVAIVKCVANGQSRDCGGYVRVVRLVEEVKPWFRLLDANTYEKLHRVLVTYLGKSTLFLVGELMSFDGDIVCSLCIATLQEYAHFSMKSQSFKFARGICSSLFCHEETKPSVVINILTRVLVSLTQQCKAVVENGETEFVELVSYCARKCRTAATSFGVAVAECIQNLAGHFCQAVTPLDSILRLYSIGLYITDCTGISRSGNMTTTGVTNNKLKIPVLHQIGDRLHELAPLLGSLGSYFFVTSNRNCVSCSIPFKDSDSQTNLHNDTCLKAFSTYKAEKRKVYLITLLDALKFLCQPLAEVVNSNKKEILSEKCPPTVSSVMVSIQEAFHQLCDTFLILKNEASEKDGDGIDENPVILSAAVAMFILSIRSNFKLKKSVHQIKHIITGDRIQPEGLRYLSASLYNTGVCLYKNEQVVEALKALKLSCRALWVCLALLCQMCLNTPHVSKCDRVEDEIIDLVTESCTRTAFLLDVIHQRDSLKMEAIMVNSLENWSAAEDFLRRLPGPVSLVKQWVKIQFKLYKNKDADDGAPTLYKLLPSSISKRATGKILLQELLAYDAISTTHPNFCQRMQMKIIDTLLHNVYITDADCLQKSKLLIKKGQVLRAHGLESFRDCIQCLSDAISLLISEINGSTENRHQLAVAYCLRALSSQEADPESKHQVFQDIKAALTLWLGIPIPDYGSSHEGGSMLADYMLLLLFNLVDLLALKGSVEFQHDMYKLMMRIFKQKNLSLQMCLHKLWQSRRLSHAICVSPIHESLIRIFSEEFGEMFNSVDFWMRCLKDCTPSLVGFLQKFSHLFPGVPCGSCNPETSNQLDITVDDIKETAVQLLSEAPTSSSVFVAGCLYYDLCDRLMASGRLLEAISYAKEAHRLRTALFRDKFTFSVVQQTEKCAEASSGNQKFIFIPQKLQVCKSITREIWSPGTVSCEKEDCYLTPWKVLQCYLESTLQVGIIYEMIGNGVVAEALLLWGKRVSCLQSLSFFEVAFSSVLGKLYRKKQSWDSSEKELQNAKKVLESSHTSISCLKCRLIFEVDVNQKLGDFYRNRIVSAEGGISLARLSLAENSYKLALDKLSLPEWKNSVSCPEEVENGAEDAFAHSCTSKSKVADIFSVSSGAKPKRKMKKTRTTQSKTKSTSKEQGANTAYNTRYRSLKNKVVNGSNDVQLDVLKHSKARSIPNTSSMSELLLEMKGCTAVLDGELGCICNKLKCWFCLGIEVKESGVLNDFINMKWEFVRRQHLLRILIGRAKFLEVHGEIHEAHEIILKAMFVLISRNLFAGGNASIPLSVMLDLFAREFSEDVFAIERAAVLYILGWSLLKGYHLGDTRAICCDLSNILLPKLVSWLMLAFVLCREFPSLFQKVAKLLSIICIISSSSNNFSLPFYCKELSPSHWASYFHQASVGTHITCHFSNMTRRCNSKPFVDYQGSHVVDSTCIGAETCSITRLAPDSIQQLEQFVCEFFQNLPCATVICISVVGGSCASLLQELLILPSSICAWMLLSRLNLNSQPVVMLLPINSILEGVADSVSNSFSAKLSESSDPSQSWNCPWCSSIVDDVVPEFRLILEENYLSSSIHPMEDTKQSRTLWWSRRKKLDCHLGQLLRNLEESWFGPWRHVLLGQLSNCKSLNTVGKMLVQVLKTKCKMEVDESFLKIILGGESNAVGDVCISQLASPRHGCFIGQAGYSDKESSESKECEGLNNLSGLAIQLLSEAVNELEEEGSIHREPVILVMDSEVQMLPWENFPVLRNEEVYRMPSVGIISLMLDRSCHSQQQATGTIAFPWMDPLDVFYLLNPSGDLSHTHLEFENWFKEKEMEGIAGSSPTAEELAVALKSHDLFTYFGHGSGSQYISRQEIQKLDHCAAALLMGCSSGSLSLNGCYAPQGTALSFLLAGSPVIVANLWEVTDKDIDRFGKAILDAWLEERSNASTNGCSQCHQLAQEFQAMNLTDKGKKLLTDKGKNESGWLCLNECCEHRPKVGAFVGQARDACALPFLIGAAPVCYGLPTGIRRKKK